MATTKELRIKVKQTGAKKSQKEMTGLSKSVAGTIGKYVGLGIAVSAVTRFLKGSIDLYKRQELAEKKLAAALGFTSHKLLDYAAALQKVSVYGDEAIIEAQNLIAAFVKDEDQIKKATKATLDFAAATGMDLKGAAALIAKTLGSSTNAMTRYGIAVNGAVGSTERLESLASNIERVFGGQAAAEVDTLSGALAQLGNKFGDMREEMMGAAVEGSGFINIIKGTGKALDFTFFHLKRAMKLTPALVMGTLDQTIQQEKLVIAMEEITKNAEAMTKGNKKLAESTEVVKTAYQEWREEHEKKIAADKKASKFLEIYNANLLRQAETAIFKPIDFPIIPATQEYINQIQTLTAALGGEKAIELFDISNLRESDKWVNDIAQDITSKYTNAANMISDSLSNAFMTAFQSGANFGDIMIDQLKQMMMKMLIDLFVKQMVFKLISSFLPGAGAIGTGGGFLGSLFGGGKQSGGEVERGMAYVVGEKRPELFVPNQSGTIVPDVGGVNIHFHGAVTDRRYVDEFIVPRIKKTIQLGRA